jgi:pimeloyl-ACP methyl ester carboxylesterase
MTTQPPLPPPPALPGPHTLLRDSDGQALCVYLHQAPADGRAPLLLVHSVNATASAQEVRPLYEAAVAQGRTVAAIDLPGYGLSARTDRRYTPRLMTDALLAAVDQLQQLAGPRPVQALSASLACEYLARAAAEQPARFASVALVSPTGFSGTRRRLGPPGASREIPWLYRLLANPRWAPGLYRQLTRPGVIRYFLAKTWGSPAIDEALWRYDVATAQVAGARHAPLHFLSAGLFSADINALYDALPMPVWVAHGTRGDFVDYRGLAAMAGRPNWSVDVFQDCGALMYFEQPDEFQRRWAAASAG